MVRGARGRLVRPSSLCLLPPRASCLLLTRLESKPAPFQDRHFKTSRLRIHQDRATSRRVNRLTTGCLSNHHSPLSSSLPRDPHLDPADYEVQGSSSSTVSSLPLLPFSLLPSLRVPSSLAFPSRDRPRVGDLFSPFVARWQITDPPRIGEGRLVVGLGGFPLRALPRGSALPEAAS